jgi:tetratricopeptide (TPR) repeat protein
MRSITGPSGETSMSLTRNFLASACLVAMAASTPAYAQYSPEITKCMNDPQQFTPEVMINTCNSLVKSGQWTGKDAAWLYNNIGKGYFLEGDYQSALTNYNQALNLDPNDAFAYCGRGLTKNKITPDSGDDDIAQARKLNSNLCND